MGNFWAEQVRKSTPQRPQQAPAPRNPAAPWWRDDTALPQPAEDVPLPGDGEYKPTVALQQKMSTCPGCGGDNYAQVNGADPRARFAVWQCFECGYPVQHSTAGLNNTSSSSGQKGTPTRQITTGGLQNNYHPQDTSAGRVG